MGFFSSILGTLKEFMAVTAMLYHKLFLGFESLRFLERVISPNVWLFFSVVVTFIDQSSLSAPFQLSVHSDLHGEFLFIGFYESFFTFFLFGLSVSHQTLAFSPPFWFLHATSFWQISFWVSLFSFLLFACSWFNRLILLCLKVFQLFPFGLFWFYLA